MPPSRRAPSPRALQIVLGVALGCAALWHTLPHLVWSLYLEPQFATLPAAHRLDVPFVAMTEETPSGFAAVSHAGVALKVPSSGAAPLSCDQPTTACQLELENGRVVIHSQPPPEDFWEMVWLRAPDRRDLSLLRGADFNWLVIDALRTRVETSRSKLESWRFESQHTRGVVALTQRGPTANYIVAAYARKGAGARILGVSNLSQTELLQILGTIRFENLEPL